MGNQWQIHFQQQKGVSGKFTPTPSNVSAKNFEPIPLVDKGQTGKTNRIAGFEFERQAGRYTDPPKASINPTDLEFGKNLYSELAIMSGSKIMGEYTWEGTDGDCRTKTFSRPTDMTAKTHCEMYKNDPERYRSLVSPETFEATRELYDKQGKADTYRLFNDDMRASSREYETAYKNCIARHGGEEAWNKLSHEETREIIKNDPELQAAAAKSDSAVAAFFNHEDELLAQGMVNPQMEIFQGEEDAQNNFNAAISQPTKFTPEQVYERFTGAIAENKNNPAALDSIVSAFLDQFADSYDREIWDNESKFTGAVAPTNAEALRKFLNSDGNVNNAICGTIHGAVMRALDDAGIEAACVNVTSGDKNQMHYTLIYKTGENNYTFNNYGHSVRVAAPNVLNAVQTIQKENIGNQAHSDGFVSLCNDEGSFKQYSLTDVAAFGNQVGPIGTITHPGAPLQERGAYVATKVITEEDFTMQVGFETQETIFGKANAEVELKTTGESEIAHSSVSVGVHVQTNKEWSLSNEVNLNLTTNSVVSVTNLNQGSEKDGTAYNGTILTVANQTKFSAEKNLINNSFGSLGVEAGLGTNLAATIVPGSNGIKAGNGMATEQAFGKLNYDVNLGNTALSADTEFGAVARHSHTQENDTILSGFVKPDFGFYNRTTAQIITQNEEGFNVGFNGYFSYYQDSTQTQVGAGAGGNVSYTANDTTLNLHGDAQYNRQDLHHAFNETTENSIKTNFGLSAERKTSDGVVTLNAGLQNQFDLTGYDKPKSAFTLGFGYRWN